MKIESIEEPDKKNEETYFFRIPERTYNEIINNGITPN